MTIENPLRSKFLINSSLRDIEGMVDEAPGSVYKSARMGYVDDDIIIESGKIQAIYEFFGEAASMIAIEGSIYDGKDHGKYIPQEVSIYTITDKGPTLEFKIEKLPVRKEDEGPKSLKMYDPETKEETMNKNTRLEVGDEVIQYSFIGKQDYKSKENLDAVSNGKNGYCILDVPGDSQSYFLVSQVMQVTNQILGGIYNQIQEAPMIQVESRGLLRIGDNDRLDKEISLHMTGTRDIEGNYLCQLIAPKMWYCKD